jgi:hypothetical protein
MNIFVVDPNPHKAATDLCDKHVVKMIVETAQMLSTAHRVLDGTESTRISKTGRKIKHWQHPDSNWDSRLCLATMINHPCTRWAMQSSENYEWLWDHGMGLLKQYTLRYHKIHSMQNLFLDCLFDHPQKIEIRSITPFAQAMPDQYRNADAVVAYRNYYIGEKRRFATWKFTPSPDWWRGVG